jgi:hypothetical protein
MLERVASAAACRSARGLHDGNVRVTGLPGRALVPLALDGRAAYRRAAARKRTTAAARASGCSRWG